MEHNSKSLRPCISAVADSKLALIGCIVNTVRLAAGNDPLTFNDETDFPILRDISGRISYVVGMRAVLKGEFLSLQVNTAAGDDDFGLNPNSWQDVTDFKRLDLESTVAAVENAITRLVD